jgi:thymidine phosphorylase
MSLEAVGIKVNVLFTDGSQPIGRGLVPHWKLWMLSVLRNEIEAPKDLRNKALLLPRALLTWYTKKQKWTQLAKEILSSGEAYKKFLAICKAQGGFREPEFAL